MDNEKNTFYNDFKSGDFKKGGSPEPPKQTPAPSAQGGSTPTVDLKNSFLYSRMQLMRSAVEGFTREQMGNVAQNLMSVDCEKFAKAHPEFPACDELLYIRGGIETPGTEAYDRYNRYREMFPDPVPAVTRAYDELNRWAETHPGDNLALVILAAFEEVRGENDTVDRKLWQVLENEGKGLPAEDAMLLFAQLGLTCDLDGWITRNFGIATPVKSQVAADSSTRSATPGNTVKTSVAGISGGVAKLTEGLPKAQKVAFFLAAAAAILYLLSIFRGILYVIPAAAAALLAYQILKGKDLSAGNTLMAVPMTLTTVLGVFSLLRSFRFLFSPLSLLSGLLSVAVTVVLWLAVLGRMTDRRKLAAVLIGGLAVQLVLSLLFGGSYLFPRLAGVCTGAAYLIVAYLTFQDALKSK